MATTSSLEILSAAFDALTAAGDFETCADPRAYIRAENRLFDAAVDCGMSLDEVDVSSWAAGVLTAWFVSGPELEVA